MTRTKKNGELNINYRCRVMHVWHHWTHPPPLGNWQDQREKGVGKMVVKKKSRGIRHVARKAKYSFQNKPVFILLVSHSAKAHKGWKSKLHHWSLSFLFPHILWPLICSSHLQKADLVWRQRCEMVKTSTWWRGRHGLRSLVQHMEDCWWKNMLMDKETLI